MSHLELLPLGDRYLSGPIDKRASSFGELREAWLS